MRDQATEHKCSVSDIASAQKLVILAVVVGLVGNIYWPIMIVTLPFMVFAGYRLATALGMSTESTVLFLIAMLIPFLGLVCLLVLNARATRALRKAGVRVGLLGAKGSDLETVCDDAL